MKYTTKSFLNLLLLAFASSKAINEEENILLPKFSLASGFYDEPIELEIKTSNPEAIIYYTTDGSIPNENSTIYEKPILLKNKSYEDNVYSNITNVEPSNDYVPSKKVKKANIIRAIAKLPNSNNTNSTTTTSVISKTYFVGMNKKELYFDFPVISLITDPYNLFDYEYGIYVLGKVHDDWIKEDPANANLMFFLHKGNYNLKGREAERPATIEYFPGNGDREGFNEDVGIRIMGDASRSFIQKSFRIFFRKEYGAKNLKYDIIPDNIRSDGKGLVKSYKTINIRSGGNDSKWFLFRDKVLQSLVKDRNFETQQGDIAAFYLDGEYWGLYTINENYNDNYFATNYDIDKDNVILIKKYKIEEGVEEDLETFNEAMNFIMNHDMTNLENYEKASQLLDLDSFIWYMVFNTYISNDDGIFNDRNWAMWRVRDPVPGVLNADGKWRMIVFDTELSSGIYDTNYKSIDSLMNALTEGTESSNFMGSKLLSSLLKNKEFKNSFYNAICDVKNIDFNLDTVNSVIDSLKERVDPLVYDHFIRYGKMADLEFEGPFEFDPNNPIDFKSIDSTKSTNSNDSTESTNSISDPNEFYDQQYQQFKDWLNGRPTVFLDLIAKLFKLNPAVEVTVTSTDFTKGSFQINHGKKIFEKEFKGDYFTEAILYLTAIPSEGETFNYWSIENCQFADSNTNTTNTNTNTNKLEEITVGILPNEGCKVIANFGPVSEIPTEIPTEVSTEIPTEILTEIPTEIPNDISNEVPKKVKIIKKCLKL
ncbi:hypothetical protein BCR32DRAFT_250394 [Anaeromyces robustus]|uniref:GH29D-like beta-sandwich domain-containing protein n=1 Tax=Anaeromyces robustus TaxID=1754192 RepID=A0A1Y1W2F0_9FUNG|nr:hypothetical protein BCR32DRAFT_250394 [Anaeromyces robustus]|eukprot:ORX67730.1 hypothetical protein BCR32DRAFT_250394 [Anaeromyces robustus]